jgi:hypothetical protein
LVARLFSGLSLRGWLLPLGCLVASSTVSSAAEDWPDGGLNKPGCFARSYSEKHLAGHPHQVVTSLRLLLNRSNPDGRGNRYRLEFGVKVRGRSNELKTTIDCRPTQLTSSPETYLQCLVECGGGGVAIKFQGRMDTALVYLGAPIGPGYISLISKCAGTASSESYDLQAGVDDHIFRVFAADMKICLPLSPHSVPWRE